jgi:PknH-like extracellular domain
MPAAGCGRRAAPLDDPRWDVTTQPVARTSLLPPPPGPQWRYPPPPPRGWAPAPWPPQPRRSTRKWVLGAAAAATVTALVATVIGVATHGAGAQPGDAARAENPTASSPIPTPSSVAESQVVSVDKVPGLLLGPADVGAVMAAPGMVVTDRYEQAGPLLPGDTVSNIDCLGALYPGMEPAYRGRGYIGFQGQRVAEPGDQYTHLVFQYVVSFPNPAAAQAFVSKSAQTWTRCAGTVLTYHYGDKKSPDEDNLIGQPSSTDSSVSNLDYQEGGGGWSCSHVLAAKANVVADTTACGQQMSDQGVKLANKILAQVP